MEWKRSSFASRVFEIAGPIAVGAYTFCLPLYPKYFACPSLTVVVFSPRLHHVQPGEYGAPFHEPLSDVLLLVFPHLHLEPYELFWKANSAEPVRVHGGVYTSPAFIEAHDALQLSPPEPGCARQRIVIALMFSSDGTHLTEYGDAYLHPLYAELGNESKDRRSKQSNGCFEHIAYFESVGLGRTL